LNSPPHVPATELTNVAEVVDCAAPYEKPAIVHPPPEHCPACPKETFETKRENTATNIGSINRLTNCIEYLFFIFLLLII
jgi:hypothetical protein